MLVLVTGVVVIVVVVADVVVGVVVGVAIVDVVVAVVDVKNLVRAFLLIVFRFPLFHFDSGRRFPPF